MEEKNIESSDDKSCVECGASVSFESKFCSHCGAAQAQDVPEKQQSKSEQEGDDFFQNMTKRQKVWLGVGAATVATLLVLGELWPTGLDDVSAVVTDCGFGEYGGASVEIRNNTNESLLVQVSVGWYDASGRQLESWTAQETVAAQSTANGQTILGPGVAYESCKVIKVLGL